MQNRAVVINAGIGALSLGLKMAGFEIVAAFEADKKTAEIHRQNLDNPVFEERLETIDPRHLPEMEVLAAQINLSTCHATDHTIGCEVANQIRSILHCKCPRAFFLLVNVAFAKSRQFSEFLNTICHGAYSVSFEMVDVGRATGFPVNERMACAVGLRCDMAEPFYFPTL